MKKSFLFIVILTAITNGFSQEYPFPKNVEIKSYSKADPSFENDLPKILEKIEVNDTLIYQLEDMAYTAALDSLWLKELTSQSLFDSITNMVQGIDYKEVNYVELPTEILKERLSILDAKTPFKVKYNSSLESVIKMYLKRHRPAYERLMGLSTFYFPGFEEALDKYNLPLELKYLAIVESALRPQAQSSAGAMGLWQFMYATGKQHNLEINSYVDERMDPALSTEAACQYLSYLYGVFGDWNLALAAYNSGPGNVAKAIRRSGGETDYWALRKYLPRETAGYVPAFLATMYVFEYAQEHGYRPEKPDFNYFETDTIQIKRPIALEQVASFTGLPLEQIQYLNPTYRLDFIPKNETKNHVLRLPVDAVGKFVTNEAEIYNTIETLQTTEVAAEELREPPIEQPRSTKYKIKSGDFLGKIAERYGVGVSELKRWNNLRSNNLKVGQRLTIYTNKAQNMASARSVTSNTANRKKTYVVRSGDSLWTIAKKFPGVSSENLQVWNDISGKKLKVGMTLTVSN